ncbi:hypothetical protein MTR67_015559 [Solanum verrucosum]|uniref:Uncharacterized protein n=1 Tax=Solanum verrucosum TaxID=315347 RepID=A0AAF0QLP3_SOLVR|nr:hypothetical protein MTR67_015559 [Solanum verrucosum]
MKLNDSVFYSAPTASKSFQGIGHREDSIVRPAIDQHISHPVLSEHKHIEFCFRNRCQFEVTIQDGTGSTTAMISDKIGGALLSLTVADIHEIRCIKKQLLPLIPVQHKLLGKTFTIQIKKLFAKHKDASSAKLFIMSITEEDIASNLALPLTAPTTPESSKRKLKQIMTKED